MLQALEARIKCCSDGDDDNDPNGAGPSGLSVQHSRTETQSREEDVNPRTGVRIRRRMLGDNLLMNYLRKLFDIPIRQVLLWLSISFIIAYILQVRDLFNRLFYLLLVDGLFVIYSLFLWKNSNARTIYRRQGLRLDIRKMLLTNLLIKKIQENTSSHYGDYEVTLGNDFNLTTIRIISLRSWLDFNLIKRGLLILEYLIDLIADLLLFRIGKRERIYVINQESRYTVIYKGNEVYHSNDLELIVQFISSIEVNNT